MLLLPFHQEAMKWHPAALQPVPGSQSQVHAILNEVRGHLDIYLYLSCIWPLEQTLAESGLSLGSASCMQTAGSPEGNLSLMKAH